MNNLQDAGNYRCTAVHAINQPLEANVDISVFSEFLIYFFTLEWLVTTPFSPVGITWEDAPLHQYASLDGDYKVKYMIYKNI